MKRATSLLVPAVLAACSPDAATKRVAAPAKPPQASPPTPELRELALPDEVHLKNVRQLTFGGDNAEAYWSFSGDRLILQSNRKPYDCDQIEVLSATGGAAKRVSTGKGRTTCSYFLPGDREILYASTHESSPKCPTPPDMSNGYVWGLFEFDIFRANADGTNLKNLTPGSPGYDAEATVCPIDGSVVFTSMRSGDLELYRMDADGKNVRQLTNLPGYDGGAFFSADCKKIVWRSSRPSGTELEDYKALLAQHLVKPGKMDLYVANADGSDARQVTYLPGASFAPFFFPDGKRVMFSSNYLNPRSGEFDLFAIDIDGSHLERITYSGGFDGFPVFSPDGKTLAFSSNRRDIVAKDGEVYRMTGGPAGVHDTNVFLADWVAEPGKPSAAAAETAAADRFAAEVGYLAADEREGRGMGTRGLTDATEHVRAALESLGLEPGNAASWRQELEVTTQLKRGAATALAIDGQRIASEEFAPMAFSRSGTVAGAIVAVGWGLFETRLDPQWKDTTIDDYKSKNVAGKIVLVHRFVPPDAKFDARDTARLGDLRAKAFAAKQNGAIALIVVDDGDPSTEEAPVPKLNAVDSASQIPVIVVTRKAGAALRAAGNHKAALTVALEPVRTKTANVVGVIKAGAPNRLPGVVVAGAHLDHLGMGGGTNALDPTVDAIHNGADDNASGIAALLEVARALVAKRSELQRDVYVVAFTAEEMGTLGSDYYVKHPPTKQPIVAMLNLDMVGRMKLNHLHVNGGDSAAEWKSIVEPACAAARVECDVGGSGYGPSDHMPFYVAGVPVLFMFTGSHREYHTANDDSHLINAAGGARVAAITADVALAVANRSAKLTYVKSAPEPMVGDVRRRGASLGTIPSYGVDPNAAKGMVVSDVQPDGPAAKAGLKGGDRIIQIGTAEIASVADLMYVLEQAKPGTQVKITFVRDNKLQQATATYGPPRSRK